MPRAQAISIDSVTQVEPAAANVPKYSKLELLVVFSGVSATKFYETVASRQGLSLQATFDGPAAGSADSTTVYGYYDGNNWRIRFSPTVEGTWTFSISATDSSGTATSGTGSFQCIPSPYHGFARIDGRFMRFSDGQIFFGAGHNTGWQYYNDAQKDRPVEQPDLSTLAAAGTNLLSFWMATPWAHPSYDSSDNYWKMRSAIENIEGGLGNYNQWNCNYLDGLVARAESNGIYLLPSLWAHDQLREPGVPWGGGNWADNAYSTIDAAGSPGTKIGAKDFYVLKDAQNNDTDQWHYQQSLYRYIVARWGYSRAIVGWVGVVEINGTTGWVASGGQATCENWCRAVRDVFVAQDFYRTNSLGQYPFAVTRTDSNAWDAASGSDSLYMRARDEYTNQKVDTAIAGTVGTDVIAMRAAAKPVFFGEFGGDTQEKTQGSNPTPPFATQPLHLHNGIWSGTAAGACYAPILWTDGGDFPMIDGSTRGLAMRDQYTFLGQFINALPWYGHSSLATAAVSSTTNCQGWVTRAPDRGFAWIRATNGNVGGQGFSIGSLTAGSYTVEWFDAWSAIGTPYSTSTVSVSSSTMTLSVPSGPVHADVALRFSLDPTTWDGGGNGTTWNSNNNWNPNGAVSGSTTRGLRFPALASAYTANNNISGTFTLNRLVLDSSSAGNAISGNALALDGVNPEFVQLNSGAFTVSNAIMLNTDASLSGSGTGSVNLSGAISGSNALNKTSAGTAFLNGTSNYSGLTNVSAGTLAGTGTISSVVVVKKGGALAPGGVASVGTFSVGGATFQSESVLAIRIPTASTNDVLDLSNGTLNVLSGAKLNLDLTGLPAVAKEFTIAKYSSGSGSLFSLNVTGNALNQIVAMSYRTDLSPKEVRIAIGTSPTPVKLISFDARPISGGGGVLLSWATVSEFKNAGFNLWRRDLDEGTEWLKVNPSLIPGKLNSPDGGLYRWFDWVESGRYDYKLEGIAFDGVAEMLQIAPDVALEDADDSAPDLSTLLAAIDSAASERENIRAQVLQHYTQQTAVKAALKPAKIRAIDAPLATFVDANPKRNIANRSFANPAMIGDVAKVVYGGSGVLFIPQSDLPAGYDARFLSIQRGGQPVTALDANERGLTLYAPGYTDRYTNKDVFFLSRTALPTQVSRMESPQDLFTVDRIAETSTSATAIKTFSDVYFDWSLQPYTFTPWFSNQYLTDGTVQKFTIDLPGNTGQAATLTVNLWSLTTRPELDPDHALQPIVNGQTLSSVSWQGGDKALAITFDLPANATIAGANTIELFTPNLNSGQIALLHSFSVEYAKELKSSDALKIAAAKEDDVIEIAGFVTQSLWVVDARDADHAVSLGYETQLQADGTYTARFVAANAGGPYVVVPQGSEISALATTRCVIAPPTAAGYLAVGPQQFGGEIQPLLNARNAEGLNAVFVDQETLFDYYGYGRYGPEPIRAAVRELQPRFLLLVGRTTYDYLNKEGQNVDPLCPAFFISTSYLSQTLSDPLFGDLGNGYPEVAVGRLPVNTPEDLHVAVARTLAYTGLLDSGQRALLAADRADPDAGVFSAQGDSLIVSVPETNWSRAYLGVNALDPTQVTESMRVAASGGADLILYTGHGSSRVLGAQTPRILDSSLIQSWTGNVVLLQSTCNGNWIGRNELNFRSIAMQGLVQPQGGIAASISTTTFMASEPAMAFFTNLLRQPATDLRWGEMLLKSQKWAWQMSGEAPEMASWYADLAHTECILGDPALPVYRRTSRVPAETQSPNGPSAAPGSDGASTIVINAAPMAPTMAGAEVLPPIQPLSVSRFNGRLKFATGHSSITLSGRIQANISKFGLPKRVRLQVGSYDVNIDLDRHGQSNANGVRFELHGRAGENSIKFDLSVINTAGKNVELWRLDGLMPDSIRSANLQIELQFNEIVYSNLTPVLWKGGVNNGQFRFVKPR